jgi:hypothetical protein
MKIIEERLREVAVQVMAMYERAERNRQPITGIFLDIKKAYDSVERGAGSQGHGFAAPGRGRRNG